MSSSFKCSACGNITTKWFGICPECGAGATVDEYDGPAANSGSTGPSGKRNLSDTIAGKRSDRAAIASSGAIATPVNKVIQKDETTNRIVTGIHEFDRVLGGGLVPGGVTILAGPPGVGKALEISTPILTTEGWKTMGSLTTADQVYTPAGKPTAITAVTNTFEDRPSYHLLFDTDPEGIVADENHEWVVTLDHPANLPQLVTTQTLRELNLAGRRTFIKATERVQVTKTDTDLLKQDWNNNSIHAANFPEALIHVAPISQIAHLLHSSEWDEKTFTVTVTGDSEELKLAQATLRLLGLKAAINDNTLRLYPARAHTPNELPQSRQYHEVVAVTPAVPSRTRCIEVADKDHMFLAGRALIPTHNSSIGLAVASELSAQKDFKVLYITGEETDSQVAKRALRTGAAKKGTDLGENLLLLSEQNLQNCLRQTEELRPDFIVVDSLQALLSENSEASLGSIVQVKEVATSFTHYAKHTNTPVILVGQVTKDGEIAGPRVVEHLVDTVLFFEANSETPLRLLRVIKNRYGPTDEIGCFEHTHSGLVEVSDPSGFFLNEHEDDAVGYASTLILEGVRAIPLEINALTVQSNLGNPRRVNTGIEQSRALTIQAILSKYLGLRLDNQDVYLATAGGLKLQDTATDLAVAAALISSYQNVPLPQTFAFVGETSLTGEIRAPRDLRRRVVELDRLGFKKIFTPFVGDDLKNAVRDAEIVESSNLGRFVSQLLE